MPVPARESARVPEAESESMWRPADVSLSFEARLEPRNLRVLRLHGGGRGRFG